MSSNTSSTNNQWESAYSNYNKLQNRANSLSDKYSGNAGYENSLTQAAKGANVEAQQAGNNAMSSARAAGLSKSAAATLGAQQTANAYGNSFTGQQEKAATQGQNAVSNANTSVSNQNNAMTAAQNEGNNRYNRSWGNVGFWTGTIGSILSDERMKSYKKITDSYFNKGNSTEDSDILKLMWKKETK